MDDFILTRVVHVIAVLLWIGGVAFVKLALMPVIRVSSAYPCVPRHRAALFGAGQAVGPAGRR